MTPDAARDVIVGLVEHGFDYESLMLKGHSELRWLIEGVNKRINEKNRHHEQQLKRRRR